MEFSKFIQILYYAIGGISSGTASFFDTIIEFGTDKTKDPNNALKISDQHKRRLFRGDENFSHYARRFIIYYDKKNFANFLEKIVSGGSAERLVEAFAPYIPKISLYDFAPQIASLFSDIIEESARQDRNRKTSKKQANIEKNKSSFDFDIILDQKAKNAIASATASATSKETKLRIRGKIEIENGRKTFRIKISNLQK